MMIAFDRRGALTRTARRKSLSLSAAHDGLNDGLATEGYRKSAGFYCIKCVSLAEFHAAASAPAYLRQPGICLGRGCQQGETAESGKDGPE